ncbi:hypothetical protein [Actinomadura sp. 9N215]|uniref:effector-associated constant component EACC1 n=1 Tax=Actinomadura sp. 9N215 TaxID=3375150 RepID=UPI0037A18A32
MTSVQRFELRLVSIEDRPKALRLRDEVRDVLADLGALKVEEVDVGDPPPGRRSGDLDIVGLLVAIAGSLAAIVQVLEGWQRRHANRGETDTTLTLTIGEFTVTLSHVPTPEELDRIQDLIERFDGRSDDAGN